MDRKIHFHTIQKVLSEKFGIESAEKECINNQTGEIFNIIFEKGADVALFSMKDNNEYKCLNSNGDEIDKDKIYSLINGINVKHDDGEIIISEKDFVLQCKGEAVDIEQLVKREAELYPERTNIVLKGMLQKNKFTDGITDFYVDEIVHVSREEFRRIADGENSEIFAQYNEKRYGKVQTGDHGILVIGPDGDGLMVDTQGYDYARYMGYAPKIGMPIRYMLEQQMQKDAVYEMKLYSPLKITEYDTETGEEVEIDGNRYHTEIRRKVHADVARDGDRGLAKYLADNDKCKSKVYSIKPDIEFVNGVMMGVAVIKMTKPLNQEEIESLKDYVTGQYSDGFGEGFEQHEIYVSDGEIYVHFWDYENYYIKTDEEMNENISEDFGMQGMSGMQM